MKRLVFVSIALFFLSSCGKNLTVHLAETALLWRVDDFFDINRNQRKELKSQFRQALKNANEVYVPGFEKVIFSDALVNENCAQVEKSYYEMKPQLEEMRTQFLKQSFSFIDSVEAKQIEYFIEQTKGQIKKDEKKSKSEFVNKIEKRLKRTQDVMQELFGDLSIAQQQSIQDHILEQSNDEDLILQSRKKNLAILENKTEFEAKTFMKDYIIQWLDFQTPELKNALTARELRNEKFYLNFFCQASVKQKQHLQSTVSDYLNLIRKVYISQQ